MKFFNCKMLLFFLTFFGLKGFSAVNISKVSEIVQGQNTILRFKYSGVLRSNPVIENDGKYFTINLGGVDSNSSKFKNYIDHKNVFNPSFKNESLSLKVSKNNFNSLGKPNILIKNNHFDISFPQVKSFALKNKSKVVTAKKNKTIEVKRESLDYLVEDIRNEESSFFKESKNSKETIDPWKLDKVNTTQGSIEKKAEPKPLAIEVKKTNPVMKEKKEFDMNSYLVKVCLVLCGIILLFYFSVNVFRKKVLKKNQLGFLGGNKLVEVLGRTHLSPKKSLLVIRVHDQHILVSDTDAGINFLTEIKDSAGFLREGEKNILGDNFNDGLKENLVRENLENSVKIKDPNRLYESTLDNKAKFNQLRNKFKKGKSLRA